jgi:hypothetical protein
MLYRLATVIEHKIVYTDSFKENMTICDHMLSSNEGKHIRHVSEGEHSVLHTYVSHSHIHNGSSELGAAMYRSGSRTQLGHREINWLCLYG